MILLNNHSYYSFLEGTCTIDDLIEYSLKNNIPYVCLTDTNRMNGLIELAKKAEANYLKPILGVYLTDPYNSKLNSVLIAKNNNGYSEICKIITSRNLNEDFRLVDIFTRVTGDIYFITSSRELLDQLKLTDKIKSELYVELISTKKQKDNSRKLYQFAIKYGLKFIASHPVYFKNKEDFNLHKVVTAIRLRKSLDNVDNTEVVDEEYFLKTPKVLEKNWNKLPEAIKNTQLIASNCNVNLEIGSYKFPIFKVPKGETPFSYLWKICFESLGNLFQPITDKAIKRLQYELEVIDDLNFSNYFLIVWDIIREAHKRNMMTIGRGSAANSLVSYCLGFTQVDPIEHNLYFERFLNRGRTSPPDVDLDFSWKERDEIVRYVFEKYGYERVAMISTIVTFRARSAFRETAKVFGVADREISKFSKLIPWTSAKNLPDISKKFPESKSLSFKDEPWNSIINIASKLGGFPRHLSIHPGGIVITEKPISNYVALEYAKNKGVGLIITQPDMYPIEDMGLIKIDLLSQRSLGVLRDTMNIINKNINKDEAGDSSNIINLNNFKKHL